ncbi:MAG: alpha/beta fold hydrolase [Pseudomonadota bacterium]
MFDIIDQGTGPSLVFLHGAGVDNILWAPQISAFTRTHRVIAFNLPGHGTVPCVENVQQMAQYVRTALADRNIHHYTVVGLSLGGMVALEMAGQWPDEVTHLVMVEAVPTVTNSRVVRNIGHSLLAILKWIPPQAFSLIPTRLLGAETKTAGKYLKQALARMSSQNNCIVMRAALAYDGRPHLANLSMPVLIMVGEKNKSTHKGAAEMVNAIEHCRFQKIPAAGHIANLDAPEFFTRALSEQIGVGNNGDSAPK